MCSSDEKLVPTSDFICRTLRYCVVKENLEECKFFFFRVVAVVLYVTGDA